MSGLLIWSMGGLWWMGGEGGIGRKGKGSVPAVTNFTKRELKTTTRVKDIDLESRSDDLTTKNHTDVACTH